MDRCTSCGAEIEWGVTAKARRIPLDPGTVRRGNVAIVGTFSNGTHAVDVVPPGEGDRVSHFATCPDANKHRRRK